jgi:hypothetical protein
MTIVAAGFALDLAASPRRVAMCGPLMSAVLHGRRAPDRGQTVWLP